MDCLVASGTDNEDLDYSRGAAAAGSRFSFGVGINPTFYESKTRLDTAGYFTAEDEIDFPRFRLFFNVSLLWPFRRQCPVCLTGTRLMISCLADTTLVGIVAMSCGFCSLISIKC